MANRYVSAIADMRPRLAGFGEPVGTPLTIEYHEGAFEDRRRRLQGFERVGLEPGGQRRVTIASDARLAARYLAEPGRWRIAGGGYQVLIGTDAETPVPQRSATLDERWFGRRPPEEDP